jgi:hypothetical protein
MTTPRIGPIMGGEDYLGISPPFISPTSQRVASCSTDISNGIINIATLKNLAVDGFPSVSVLPVAGQEYVIFGFAVMSNWNFPDGSAWIAGTGYSGALGSVNSVAGHPLFGTCYKKVLSASGGTYTPNGTYTGGYGSPSAEWWSMIGIALPLTAADPVQSGITANGSGNPYPNVALGSPVTVGNVIIMAVTIRDNPYGYGSPFTGSNPSNGFFTGWTLLGSGVAQRYPSSADGLVVWARCVTAADVAYSQYGINAGSDQYNISVSEWTP